MGEGGLRVTPAAVGPPESMTGNQRVAQGAGGSDLPVERSDASLGRAFQAEPTVRRTRPPGPSRHLL